LITVGFRTSVHLMQSGFVSSGVYDAICDANIFRTRALETPVLVETFRISQDKRSRREVITPTKFACFVSRPRKRRIWFRHVDDPKISKTSWTKDYPKQVNP
jgi:hypothetical protein